MDIATISHDAIRQLVQERIDAYAKSRSEGLIPLIVTGGECAGIITMLRLMDGFPKEETEAYALQVQGIGELHRLACQPE